MVFLSKRGVKFLGLLPQRKVIEKSIGKKFRKSGAADCIHTGETQQGCDIITYMIVTAWLFLDTSRRIGKLSEEKG